MSIHITPPPHADQTDQTAEPARRAPRFDERGIALQTIIIMVVLLSIAGAVAAVLFARASEETDRLEASESVEFYGITNATLCTTSGYEWKGTHAAITAAAAKGGGTTPDEDALKQAGRLPLGKDAGWCDPTP